MTTPYYTDPKPRTPLENLAFLLLQVATGYERDEKTWYRPSDAFLDVHTPVWEQSFSEFWSLTRRHADTKYFQEYPSFPDTLHKFVFFTGSDFYGHCHYEGHTLSVRLFIQEHRVSITDSDDWCLEAIWPNAQQADYVFNQLKSGINISEAFKLFAEFLV